MAEMSMEMITAPDRLSTTNISTFSIGIAIPPEIVVVDTYSSMRSVGGLRVLRMWVSVS
jgi:hypothetical protein